MNKSPLVTIGFPVYNSGSLLQRALDSLLNQNYENFELLISDNSSTDGTWEVCQKYALNDSRIKLYRNTENIGALGNFARVLTLANGTYFMWAAHDDQWEPSFISECVAKLEITPSAILCFVQHIAFDDRTETKTPVNYPMDLQNPVIWQRLYDLLMCWPLPNVIVYGLYRTELLKKADSIVFGSGAPDTLVLLKALLFGTFVIVDSPLHTYTVSQRDIKQRIKQMQFQGKHITLILLSTDFKLFRTLIQIIKQATPELRFRLLLLKSAIIFMYRVAGWPISLRLIARYLSPLLPDNWSNKVKLLLKK